MREGRELGYEPQVYGSSWQPALATQCTGALVSVVLSSLGRPQPRPQPAPALTRTLP